jgi:hypothetical protein
MVRAAPRRIVDQRMPMSMVLTRSAFGSEHGLDRIRQVIVQAGLHAHMLAEAQHDAEFVGLDAEEAGQAPDHERAEQRSARCPCRRNCRPAARCCSLSWLRRSKVFEIGRPRPDDCGPEPHGPFGPEPQGRRLDSPRHRKSPPRARDGHDARPRISAWLYRGPPGPYNARLVASKQLCLSHNCQCKHCCAVNALSPAIGHIGEVRRYRRPDRPDSARARPLPIAGRIDRGEIRVALGPRALR